MTGFEAYIWRGLFSEFYGILVEYNFIFTGPLVCVHLYRDKCCTSLLSLKKLFYILM